MSDLVERLIQNADCMKSLDIDYSGSEPLLREAASELARLRAELTAANAMVAQKSEQYVAERKAHEATRAALPPNANPEELK